jgi:hypothetical protein
MFLRSWWNKSQEHTYSAQRKNYQLSAGPTADNSQTSRHTFRNFVAEQSSRASSVRHTLQIAADHAAFGGIALSLDFGPHVG